MAYKIINCGDHRKRRSFSSIRNTYELSDLLEIQRKSYNWFIEKGIEEVFKDLFPIENFAGTLSLEFGDYHFDEPRYSIKECKERYATFAAPLKVEVRLFNNETGEVKEQEIFLGDMPLMTESGTFVINGAERVIVSQLVRSPSVYFNREIDKNGRLLITSQIIPTRGTWLEFETDAKDVIYVRIDRTRKVPLTTLLRAFGLSSDEDILSVFGKSDFIENTINKDSTRNTDEALIEIYEKLRPGEPATLDSSKNQIITRFFDEFRYDLAKVGRYKFNLKLNVTDRLLNQTLAEDILVNGELIFSKGDVITKDLLPKLKEALSSTTEEKEVEMIDFVKTMNLSSKEVLEVENLHISSKEKINSIKFDDDVVAGSDIVEKFGFNVTSDFATIEAKIKNNLVVLKVTNYGYGVSEIKINEDLDTYNKIQKITIMKPNSKEKMVVLGNDSTIDSKRLTISDFYAATSYYLNLLHGVGNFDEIDHLGNRRIRQVGELLQNQFRVGVTRMERVIRERMTTQDIEEVTPKTLINIRPVTAILKEFFGSSQLSQFMDQTNPIAELTHKRRLSALGPGGLSRDRASMEVRDVNESHYGRICPIESPEGPNIGLITALASYAKIDDYGFILTPYRKVNDCQITDEIVYLRADEENDLVISESTVETDDSNKIIQERVAARFRGENIMTTPEKVDYIDVSPQQVVSITTSCIPFLEHDDATRALMGSNMQRQAVPLLVPEAPYVGTGVEWIAARDSGSTVVAKADGIVTYVDGRKIVVENKGGKDEYILTDFTASNQNTCFHHRPIVRVGDEVKRGHVIADGPSTDQGELALGKNLVVAFTMFNGYNYEDAVILNERLVKEDVLTTVHIEDYEMPCRETKLGPEEITRDIPNVSEEARKNLDSNGIIRIGTEVKEGDILVGKVTPKGMAELTSEEKLLHAIFGEKTREVRDTSLRVPHGGEGIVHDIKVFTRKDSDELAAGVSKLVRVYIVQKRKIQVGDKMAGRHGNKGCISLILPEEDMPYLPDGTPVDVMLNPLGVPSRMNIGQVLELHLGMAGKKLGVHFATPVFDGATEQDIIDAMKEAGMDEDGKTVLYDGRTGRPFDNRVSVGVMYMIKLIHMVEDKMHARATGPYSLVTQQPLGGKAQFGGQRFGEMEVWALYAYGAAHTLQEILTIKSDDVIGRVKVYEALVKGQKVDQAGVPESFRVLIKEFQALGLDIQIINDDDEVLDLKEIEKEETKKEINFSIDDVEISKIESDVEEDSSDEEEIYDEENLDEDFSYESLDDELIEENLESEVDF